MRKIRSRLLAAVLALMTLGTAGCVLTEGLKRPPVPTEVRNGWLVDANQDRSPYEPIDPQMILALKRALRKGCDLQQTGQRPTRPPVNVLAISGGGSYGAFDVGVLHGWSESGTRPSFDVVTGISTGALIATFAFLGSQYDDFLRDAYVKAKADDIYETRWLLSLIHADSLARSVPLRRKIDAAITPEILKEVAAAHAKGRRLYVGTTNLDTRRFVIWDMGAIASNGSPESLKLYREIILASAAVPGFFSPVLIDIEVDGKKYQELHVDGGVTSAVFLPMAKLGCDPHNPCMRPGSNVYVISSGKLYADSDTVKRQFASVTVDAISALLYAGTRNDIFKIFNMALLSGMDFHLIAIPPEFPLNPNSLSFEADELRRLYELGFEMGKTRKGGRETPPGAEPDEQSLPRTGVKFKTMGRGPDAKP